MDEARLRYSPTHEWIHVDGDLCTVGITRFAVQQLTDIVYIELPAKGKKAVAGKPFGVIESVKAVSDLYAPVNGEIAEVNNALAADPAILGVDPYEKGWMIRIRTNPADLPTTLLSKAQYDAQVAAEGHH